MVSPVLRLGSQLANPFAFIGVFEIAHQGMDGVCGRPPDVAPGTIWQVVQGLAHRGCPEHHKNDDR